jgi:hypothetical protein
MSGRKLRSDSILDGLTPEQQDAVYAQGNAAKNSLKATISWLRAEFDVEISDTRLSAWLARRRQEEAFQARLEELAAADEHARTVAQDFGDVAHLTEANIALLSQDLLDAQLAQSPAAIKAAAMNLATLVEAFAKNKKADADVEAAQTQRDKFQFDAAKAALAHAAELQEINASKLDDTEKRERAIKVLFGDRPAHVKTAKEVVP